MKKIRTLLFCIIGVLFITLLGGCSNFDDTPESNAALDVYIEAIKKSLERKNGCARITVTSSDDIIEKTESETEIVFQYTINDEGLVSFDREDFTNGEYTARYRADGYKVESFDFETNQWVDCTEENKPYLSEKTNSITTMQLFRVDNNLKINKRFLSTASQSDWENGGKCIKIVLDDEQISKVMDLYEAKGYIRKSAGQTREYYINGDGIVSMIKINTTQQIQHNSEFGNVVNSMTITYE